MSISAFTPRTLIPPVNKLGDARQNLLTRTVFVNRNTHPTGTIDFGTLDGNIKVSGYTRQGEAAKSVDKLTGKLKSLIAPEIRLKKTLDRAFFESLNPGLHNYSGPYDDPNKQIQEKIQKEQADLRRKIDRQIEISLAEAVRTGQTTITYLNPDGTTSTETIDYEFVDVADADADTIQATKTGGAVWSATTSTPLQDIRALAQMIRSYSGWGGAVQIMMGYDAANSFQSHADIKSILDTRRVEGTNFELVENAQYIGRIGAITFFEYIMDYDNDAGAKTSAWDKDTIAMIPKASDFFSLEFGSVFEFPGAGAKHQDFIQTEYFSKIHREDEPPVLDLIVQSNPLPLIKDPRAIRVLKVQ